MLTKLDLRLYKWSDLLRTMDNVCEPELLHCCRHTARLRPGFGRHAEHNAGHVDVPVAAVRVTSGGERATGLGQSLTFVCGVADTGKKPWKAMAEDQDPLVEEDLPSQWRAALQVCGVLCFLAQNFLASCPLSAHPSTHVVSNVFTGQCLIIALCFQASRQPKLRTLHASERERMPLEAGARGPHADAQPGPTPPPKTATSPASSSIEKVAAMCPPAGEVVGGAQPSLQDSAMLQASQPRCWVMGG